MSSPLASINTNFYFIIFSILTDYDTNRKKQLIWHWKVEPQKMLHQVEKFIEKNFIYNVFVWKYPS